MMNVKIPPAPPQDPPEIGASNEINTEAGVYGSLVAENGDGTPVMEKTLQEALDDALDPRWDGCIGEATARRLAVEIKLIEWRLHRLFEMWREMSCFVPNAAAERFVLTGKRS
jgi:hypothetical protein